jgi:hypothetical protein
MKNKVLHISRTSRLYKGAIGLAMLLTVAVQGLSSGTAYAASGTMSLSAASGSLQQGSSTVVTVQVSAGTDITAAQACVSYDSSKLSLTNTDYSGTPLDATTPSSASTDCSAGQVQIGRYSLTSHPSGNFTLARLTFKALASSGSNALTIGSKSFLYDNTASDPPGILNLDGSTGTTISFTAIPSPEPSPSPSSPAPTTSTKQTTKSSGTTASATTTTSSAAAITDAGRSTDTELTQAVSADVHVPLTRTSANTTAEAKNAKSRRTLFILIGATFASIIAAVVMAKFLGVPGLPRRQESIGAAPLPPTDPTSAAISHLPDAQIPGPSAVIQPEHHDDPTPKS